MMTDPLTTAATTSASDALMATTNAVSGVDTATVGTAAGSEAKSSTVDTVTLQGKAQDTKNTASAKAAKDDSTIGRIGAVLFSYNSKGALRIKFMDSKNTLIYQTPPVMMARMMDLMMRSDFSVSARV